MDVNIAMRPEAVVLARFENNVSPNSFKVQILERLSEIFSEVYNLNAADILDGLQQREVLGSTGFGQGVAIPHCRNAAVKRPSMALLKLENPCDFQSADAVPVTLVFGLVSPENAGASHLHALAAISRLLRDEAMLQALFGADDAEALFALLTNQFLRDAA
ncbi:MAG: PTS sugar transporter subunit IIA [Pseudomonadota bacterium]